MEGYRAFRLYKAIRLHFTTNYDFFRYHGKAKSIAPAVFNARKDRFIYQKLDRRYPVDEDLTNYFVANIISKSEHRWIGELVSIQSEKVYMDWKKRLESFSYTFKGEMEKLRDTVQFESRNPADIWEPNFDGDYHPNALREHYAGNISLESMVAINRVIGFVKYWDKNINEDFIWPETSMKIKKYDPFLQLPETKELKAIMKKVYLGD